MDVCICTIHWWYTIQFSTFFWRILFSCFMEKLWIVMTALTGENPQVGRLLPHHLQTSIMPIHSYFSLNMSNKSLPPMCRWLMNPQISPHGSFVFSSNVQITKEFQFVYHRALSQCAVHWWIFNTFSISLHLNVQFTDEYTIQFAMDPCLNEQLTDEFSTHVPWHDFGFQTEVWQVNIFTLQG